jgi:hypothetical protein
VPDLEFNIALWQEMFYAVVGVPPGLCVLAAPTTELWLKKEK